MPAPASRQDRFAERAAGEKPRLKAFWACLRKQLACRGLSRSLAPIDSRFVERRQRLVRAQKLGEEGDGEVRPGPAPGSRSVPFG